MSENKKAYSEDKLKEFKIIIEENLTKAKDELHTIQNKLESQLEHVSNTNVDFNENSKHFQNQAKNESHVRRLETKIMELESAMDRIEDGTYGVSERNGELIREDRLKAMPTATYDI